ncbi:cold-shock protein [Erythrobacter sp. sf7]|uniref:Cold-shock protein n=1 Tax=Erythrobacter fulvus TaxID=2987523 RepID=A0ABT5JPQ9_9SPHN|nr:cold-shock protein [Erythrobacter fulvus]MDC8754757.1 cold-shock protein [Erythrobacter fulvus]
MTSFGKIKNYDSGKGCGTIAPERGGAPLDFVKADLQQEAAEPKAGDRYGYDTRQVDGGRPHAINLQQDRQQQQAQQQEG